MVLLSLKPLTKASPLRLQHNRRRPLHSSKLGDDPGVRRAQDPVDPRYLIHLVLTGEQRLQPVPVQIVTSI